MTELVRTKEWRFPCEGVGVCSDGRLMVYEGKDRLILPAPAAAIWEDSNLRALLRGLPLPAPTPPIPRESWLIFGIEPEEY